MVSRETAIFRVLYLQMGTASANLYPFRSNKSVMMYFYAKGAEYRLIRNIKLYGIWGLVREMQGHLVCQGNLETIISNNIANRYIVDA
jgi:hypothetical protein